MHSIYTDKATKSMDMYHMTVVESLMSGVKPLPNSPRKPHKHSTRRVYIYDFHSK